MVNKITKWHLMMPFLGDYQRHAMLAEIEKELSTPHQTIKKYADILTKNKILNEEKKPKNLIYSLNRENQMVLNYISSAEKIVLEESLEKSTMLKRLYETLFPFMKESSFLIFGSSALGKPGQDIDMLEIGNSAKPITSEFSRTYGKKIHLIQSKTLKLEAAFLKEIMKKHLIFSGFEAFIKKFWESTWRS